MSLKDKAKMYKPKQHEWSEDLTKFESWITEIKYDGERNLLIIKDGDVKVQRHEGRVKSDFYPEIIEYVKSSGLINKNITLDGEVSVLFNDRKADFPSVGNRQTVDPVKQKPLLESKPVTFVAFDIVEKDGVDLSTKIQSERRAILEAEGLAKIADFKKNSVVVIDSGYEAISEATIKAEDLEGVVLKNPNHAEEWIKLKNYDEDEFEIIGHELTETGKKNGNAVSAIQLQNSEGREVGMCSYNNYPQTEAFRDTLIGRKVLVRFMKTDAYRQGKGALRFPVMMKIINCVSEKINKEWVIKQEVLTT